MKTSPVPRVCAAVMSVVITVVLFDLVATMGQPAASGDDERVLGRVAAAQSATQRTPAG